MPSVLYETAGTSVEDTGTGDKVCMQFKRFEKSNFFVKNTVQMAYLKLFTIKQLIVPDRFYSGLCLWYEF